MWASPCKHEAHRFHFPECWLCRTMSIFADLETEQSPASRTTTDKVAQTTDLETRGSKLLCPAASSHLMILAKLTLMTADSTEAEASASNCHSLTLKNVGRAHLIALLKSPRNFCEGLTRWRKSIELHLALMRIENPSKTIRRPLMPTCLCYLPEFFLRSSPTSSLISDPTIESENMCISQAP